MTTHKDQHTHTSLFSHTLTHHHAPPHTNTYSDPAKWSQKQVLQWLELASQELGLNPIKLASFNLSGAQLCALSRDEFLERAPAYTGDILYSYLHLIRARNSCKLTNKTVISVRKYKFNFCVHVRKHSFPIATAKSMKMDNVL